NYPYFSRDIGEFWRRWHISLSTWFRDYIYLPLGGSRGTKWFTMRNILIIFLITGIWHGANWTFIVYGCLHGLFYLPLIFRKKKVRYAEVVAEAKIFPYHKVFLQIAETFSLVTFARVFFRSPTVA